MTETDCMQHYVVHSELYIQEMAYDQVNRGRVAQID